MCVTVTDTDDVAAVTVVGDIVADQMSRIRRPDTDAHEPAPDHAMRPPQRCRATPLWGPPVITA